MSEEVLKVDTIDFETEAIKEAPTYRPPRPVGVSLKVEDTPSEYLAWGHPTGNNVSKEDAYVRVREFIDRADKKDGWLAHNVAFESSILRDYYHYEQKDPLKSHDTMFLLFLTNPYAPTFSLKPSAERELGLPPDEQTDLMNWILANVPGAKPSNWGAYICMAPAELCGKYAKGDTGRTKRLFNKLYPRMMQMGMLDAYRREQKLMPILMESSKRGVRVDMERLGTDIQTYGAAMKMAEDYVYSRLGEFNIDSDRELADALDKAGMVTDWVLTPTGKRSTARKNLVGRVKDPDLLNYMAYRGVLSTCLGTFAGPWLEQALNEEGRLHPSWNQTRGEKGADGDMSGTKTGRMSCIAEGELVSTQRGLVPIEKIVVGDLVTTHRLRSRPVVRTITNGQRQVFRYYLSNGLSVVCTPDHKFFTGDQWLTIEEISDGCVKEVDERSKECEASAGHLSGYRGSSIYVGDSEEAEHIESYSERMYSVNDSRGKIYSTENKTLSCEAWRLESDVRQDSGASPQLHRRLWGRISDPSSRRVSEASAPARDGEATWHIPGNPTYKLDSAPHRWESAEQRPGQLGALYEQGASEDTRIDGEPRLGVVEVTKIQFVGVRQVYDLTVEEDHSFGIAGVFAHNCKAPNLQNPPNDFESLVIPEEIGKFLSAEAERTNRIIHPVMHMRQYLLPEEGHVWVKRDFSAQEMRVMTHYAEGGLFEKFREDPRTDPHNAVMAIIKETTGITMLRKHVKIIGFGIMYGMGVDKLAASMGVPRDEGETLRNAYYAALPEIRELSLDTRNRGKRGDAIRTWGGRLYYREPNPDRDLSYKLLNFLIQGSSADQTKQSIIDYDKERASDEFLIAAVHDELNASVPAGQASEGMARMRSAMDKDRFDVPFRSEGYIGPNWADIEKFKEPDDEQSR